MRTAKLCNYFQKTKCVRTHLYFFAKKREAGASLFLVGSSRKAAGTDCLGPRFTCKSGKWKGHAPGRCPGQILPRRTHAGTGAGPPASLPDGAPVRCPGQKLPCRQNHPLRRNRPIGKAVPIGETAPSEKPFRSTALSAPIGRAAYADAPFAACPSLRAEATACAAPSAHCSAACRS